MKNEERIIQIISNINQVMKSYVVNEFIKTGIKATPTQTAVLYLLEKKDGQKISDFSNALEIKNPVMTGVIDRMEKAGFVVRKHELSDRRKISVYITPLGLKESSKAKSVIRKLNKIIESRLTDDDINICKKVLIHIFNEMKKIS